MGRRPNPVVLTFFHRGEKLADHSNRYSYTCKSCGLEFPKGRQEKLMLHLTKECPKMSDEEHLQVAFALADPKAFSRQQQDQLAQLQAAGGIDALPENQTQTLGSARLQALVEQQAMSEQHAAAGVQTPTGSSPTRTKTAGKAAVPRPPSPETIRQQQERAKLTGLEALAEASRRVGNVGNSRDDAQEVITGRPGETHDDVIDPSLQDFEQAIQSQIGAFNQDTGGQTDSSVLSQAERLSGIAASASHLEATSPQDSGRTDGVVVNGNHTLRPLAAAPSPWPNQNQDEHAPSPTDQAFPLLSPSSVVSNGSIQSPSKLGPQRRDSGQTYLRQRNQKQRGKFTDTRRKEVKEIRKMGACIRCRVLRKTCSDGVPCKTCQSVESARLWKTPCTRTKLSKVFELFSDEIFQKIAANATEMAENQYSFPGEVASVSFGYKSLPGHYMQEGVKIGLPKFPQRGPELHKKYSLEGDLWLPRRERELDEFVGKTAPMLYDHEPVKVLRYSLHIAHNICTTSNNTLLFQTLRVWNLVSLITSPLETWHYTLLPPQTNGTSTEPSDDTIMGDTLAPEEVSLLHRQIAAIVAQRASKEFTSLLNSIETLLIRPTSKFDFGFFLSGFLILSCLERLDAWCREFEINLVNEDDDPVQVALQQWPVSSPPSHYSSQAELLANLVSMLLWKRGVPPPIGKRSRYALEKHTSAVGEDGQTLVSKWLEQAQLTQEYLYERKDATFVPGDIRSLDLKKRFTKIEREETETIGHYWEASLDVSNSEAKSC